MLTFYVVVGRGNGLCRGATRQQHGYAYTDSKNNPGVVIVATPFLLSDRLFC